jgi:hypothetical protein
MASLATMNLNESPETLSRGTSPIEEEDGGNEPPSGFILKLFQMVNGAPDEVISVR